MYYLCATELDADRIEVEHFETRGPVIDSSSDSILSRVETFNGLDLKNF